MLTLHDLIFICSGDMYWTPWLSGDNATDGDDRETLIDHLQVNWPATSILNIPNHLVFVIMFREESNTCSLHIVEHSLSLECILICSCCGIFHQKSVCFGIFGFYYLLFFYQAYDILCKIPTDIQCRTVYEGIPANESGQIFNINCTMSAGLKCVGADQGAVNGNTCYDYKVRYSCPERE